MARARLLSEVRAMRFDEVMGLDRTGRLSSIRTTSARCPGARSPRSRSPTARAGLVETTVFLIDTLSRFIRQRFVGAPEE